MPLSVTVPSEEGGGQNRKFLRYVFFERPHIIVTVILLNLDRLYFTEFLLSIVLLRKCRRSIRSGQIIADNKYFEGSNFRSFSIIRDLSRKLKRKPFLKLCSKKYLLPVMQ